MTEWARESKSEPETENIEIQNFCRKNVSCVASRKMKKMCSEQTSRFIQACISPTVQFVQVTKTVSHTCFKTKWACVWSPIWKWRICFWENREELKTQHKQMCLLTMWEGWPYNLSLGNEGSILSYWSNKTQKYWRKLNNLVLSPPPLLDQSLLSFLLCVAALSLQFGDLRRTED